MEEKKTQEEMVKEAVEEAKKAAPCRLSEKVKNCFTKSSLISSSVIFVVPKKASTSSKYVLVILASGNTLYNAVAITAVAASLPNRYGLIMLLCVLTTWQHGQL